MKIRNFEAPDYQTIAKWWMQSGEPAPAETLLLETKTFVVEVDARPVVAVTIYLGDSPWFGVVEDLIADPALSPDRRREAILLLWDFVQGLFRALKYKRVFCFTKHERLVTRYLEAYGWEQSATGVTSLVKFL